MSKQHFPLPSGALTIKEAAGYLRISEASVWRLLKDKQLRRVRIGGRTVVRRIDLDAFLERSLDSA
jgi:excisionase family DNA binding protein